MPKTIADYYRAVLEQLRQEVERTPDDRVLGVDIDHWIDYLVARFAMAPIEIDGTRSPEMVEVETEYTQRGYDPYSDRGPGTVVRSTNVRISVPVVPSETLQEIWKHELAPNPYSLVKYPEFEYRHDAGTIETVVGIDKRAVTDAIEKIKQAVVRYNSNIESENQVLRPQIVPIVKSKHQRVAEKHSKLDTLAAAVGIPLTKKTDPSKVVVTTPKVRQKIAPVMPPPTKRQERPVLDAGKFAAILELIDNQCRGFERTPQSYAILAEEGLRDIILGGLNTVFEGAAVGEAFQGIGKVDIHLRIAQGEVFVAEVKFWAGEASLLETIGQLRGRLTWRDSYGVAILLSKNVGFTDVLKAVSDAIPKVDGYATATLRNVHDNHFVARFSIPSDPGRQAEVHILVYNLYTDQPGKRQTRRT